MERPIQAIFPKLREALPFAGLGAFPSPVERLPDSVAPGTWIKRDDQSAETYGGNKVRTLEVLFGRALADGARTIFASGAYGSNHAVATILHAARVGLAPAAILFPQPPSVAAAENLEVVLSRRPELVSLPHWSLLPFAIWRTRRRPNTDVMIPGGATPFGALGYVSAAFELAEQVERGELDAPHTVVIGVGSTCTSAGLLLGFSLAARFGIGFYEGPPRLVSVRVTPWPVTASFRIVSLADRTGRLLEQLTGDRRVALSRRALAAHLEVDGRFLGRGYGHPTEPGHRAAERFTPVPGLVLDTTYGAKSAAGFLERAAFLDRTRVGGERPILYWATKSSLPLPPLDPIAIAEAPKRMRRFLEESRQTSRRP